MGDGSINKMAKYTKGHTPWHKGRTGVFSEEVTKKLSDNQKGDGNSNWKGDNAKYQAKHAWVRRVLGKPMICTQCGFESDNPYKIHWANISGEYRRDTADWVRLCASCHNKFDENAQRGWVTRRAKQL